MMRGREMLGMRTKPILVGEGFEVFRFSFAARPGFAVAAGALKEVFGIEPFWFDVMLDAQGRIEARAAAFYADSPPPFGVFASQVVAFGFVRAEAAAELLKFFRAKKIGFCPEVRGVGVEIRTGFGR